MPADLRRREIADDAVKAEQRLGQLALEMALEHLGRAAHREIVDGAGFGERQSGHVAAEAEQLGDRADPAPDVGRGPKQPLLQQPDDDFELRDVAVVRLAVGFHVAHNLAARQPAAAREQIVAVAGEEIVGLSKHDLQAMALELEVADDLGVEQADRVARRAVSKAGKEFVGHGRAPDIAASLQDRDLHPLLRQIISASQAVVARPDHDRIEFHRSPGLVEPWL